MTPLEKAALLGKHDAMQILFPITSCIPTVPEWSYRGIVKHAHSEESKKKREIKRKEIFLYTKSQGEASFKSREYPHAIHWYTRAIDYDPSDARVLANRSLCFVKLSEGEKALEDAVASIKLDPTWAKAYYRAGIAYNMVENYPMAVESFSNALKLDPENKEILEALEQADSQTRIPVNNQREEPLCCPCTYIGGRYDPVPYFS